MSDEVKIPRTIMVKELEPRWWALHIGNPATYILSGELPLYVLLDTLASADGTGFLGKVSKSYRDFEPPISLTGLYRVDDRTIRRSFSGGPFDFPLQPSVILEDSRSTAPRFQRTVYPTKRVERRLAGRSISAGVSIHSSGAFRVLLEDVERIEAAQIPKRKEEPAQEAQKRTGRRSTVHRERCRAIAAMIWEGEPGLTIEDMIDRPEITRHGQEDKPYTRGQLRKWIHDLCPNRKPGRRPKTRN